MQNIEEYHPKLKLVLLDAHRPFHFQNLNYSEKIIIINDDSFKKNESKWPTQEEIQFLENFEVSDEDGVSEEPSKISQKELIIKEENEEEQKEPKSAQKDDLFVDCEDDIDEKIGRKRNKKRKAEKIEKQKRFEEISDLMSPQNHEIL